MEGEHGYQSVPVEYVQISTGAYTTDDDYEETLIKWKENCHLVHFIYESAYDLLNRIQRGLGIIILLLTTSTSFLAVADVTNEYTLILTVLSCITTFFSSLGQIYGIHDRLQSYLEYLKELQQFLQIIVNREFLPKGGEGREPAKDLVLKEKDRFAKLMSSAPEIPNLLYQRYSKHYSGREDRTQARRTQQLFRITS